eukprot:3648460-Rhodomonas_salina.2
MLQVDRPPHRARHLLCDVRDDHMKCCYATKATWAYAATRWRMQYAIASSVKGTLSPKLRKCLRILEIADPLCYSMSGIDIAYAATSSFSEWGHAWSVNSNSIPKSNPRMRIALVCCWY